MPIDQQIDAISNSIFSFILWLFPVSTLLQGLNIYTKLSDNISAFYTQFCITASAIKYSFDSPVLAFFKYGTIYIPIPIYNNTQYSTLPSWIYTFDRREFTIPNTELIHMRASRLPYISAVLTHKTDSTESVLGDLSDWLGEQTVYAPDGAVPLQILVATWMYTKDPPTLLMNYKDMYLKTMDDSAEEHTYNVETEQEIEEGEIIMREKDDTNAHSEA